jgi:hypothetical protein
MYLQLVFEVAVVGNPARFLPYVAGVVVSDVPESASIPPVYVEQVLYLTVVEDFRSMGSVDFQHSERSYNHVYLAFLGKIQLENGRRLSGLSTVGCGGVVGFIPGAGILLALYNNEY